MKEFWDVTLLAILQGVAEFLPISSSGHLVIGQHLLGLEIPGMRLDVFLHLGTLVAIFAFYWQRVVSLLGGIFRCQRESWAYLGKIVLSAVPACIVYALFHGQIDAFFENARMVGGFLVFTGAVLIATRFMPRAKTESTKPITSWHALGMGTMQAVALLPGVSRSGMTLAAARAGQVGAEAAAEFSFLMSAPLIGGAALLDLAKELWGNTPAVGTELSWGLILYGAVVAAAVGYLALAVLLRTLKGRWFWLFGPYCVIAGTLVMLGCK